MTRSPFLTRLRHAWAVLTGLIILPMEFETMADLTKLTADIHRLIAENQALKAQLVNTPADDTAAVEALSAEIEAVSPTPAQ